MDSRTCKEGFDFSGVTSLTSILGISSHYHDSAAAILVDGKIVAAAQQERFSRLKHDASIPKEAIEYCLRAAGLQACQIDYVAYYEKPLAKFERLLETYLSFAPHGNRFFRQSVPTWTQNKLFLQRSIRTALGRKYRKRIVFVEHHLSHAATAFYNSPFDEAAILTVDGVGEWTTTAFGAGNGSQIRLDSELQFPHSLGLVYSAFTAYLGFHVNDGEYKVMGLASYGEPEFRDQILTQLMDLRSDGSFRLKMEYFDFCCGLSMTTKKFATLFGGPPRHPDDPMTQRHKNIASSIQSATEEILLRMANTIHQRTGKDYLVIAGGVALNCVANSWIAKNSPFKQIWVHGAAGDAGGAIGATQYVWHQLLGQPRSQSKLAETNDLLLGPCFDDSEILEALRETNTPFRKYESADRLCEEVSKQIEQQRVVGWFQGRMEFGPRALGARSILADPRNPAMKEIVNTKIKRREPFRPFAPAVLQEFADYHFSIPKHVDCSTMTFIVDGSRCSESFPSIVHVDGTARIQTVRPLSNPVFHQLLTTFHSRTGCPMLINTSFNVRDEPIVCSPKDAIRCFRTANLDALAIGRFWVVREDLPETESAAPFPNSAMSFRAKSWATIAIARKQLSKVSHLLGFPVRAFVELIMLVAYLGVVTPVAWVRTRTGTLRLDAAIKPGVESYWMSRSQSQDLKSNFRQS
jgi:carbamoyltransferase